MVKKVITVVTAALILSGCANMTPGQKTAAVVVGVIIVGALAASGGGGSGAEGCKPRPIQPCDPYSGVCMPPPC